MEVERPASSVHHLEASQIVKAKAARGRDVEDAGAATMAGGASLAFSPMVLLVVPPASAPPMVPHEEKCIALPFVERSTRCTILPLFLFCWGH